MSWFAHQIAMIELAKHLGRGEHDQVVRLAEQALREKPTDTVAMTLMANSLDRLGQPDRAAGTRERLLEHEPDDRESLFLLGRYHEERGQHEIAGMYFRRFLGSEAPIYPLGGSDYRFLRFLARLLGASGKNIEHEARQTSHRLEEESTARRAHAAAYLAEHGESQPTSHDA